MSPTPLMPVVRAKLPHAGLQVHREKPQLGVARWVLYLSAPPCFTPFTPVGLTNTTTSGYTGTWARQGKPSLTEASGPTRDGLMVL